MEWTKKLPTQPGWYWMKFDPEKYPDLPGNVGDPMMMMVFESEGKVYVEDTVNQERYPVSEGQALWAGPLIPPGYGV